MTIPAQQIRDQQRETWNRFSPGWRKWDEFNMMFLRPIADEIIAALAVKANEDVLDIATGTGEPGLTIAAIHPTSKVTGTDLAEGMLAIAEANARIRGLANYRTQVADVSALPFADASFGAVSCRLGFMFFPEMQLAANEIARVMKSGARFSTSVWAAPEKNPWITTMMGAIQRHTTVPPPVPGAPGIFRCAAPNLIAGLLRQAGLVHVTEQEVSRKVIYDSADQYWTMMMEVAAPVVALMSKADEQTRAAIKTEVFGTLERAAGPIAFDWSVRIISGKKA